MCAEYSKRMDRDLPFYYYTTKHERFYEGDRPSFDKFVKSKANALDGSGVTRTGTVKPFEILSRASYT